MRAAAADAVTGVYAAALSAAAVMLTFIAIADELSLTVIAALSSLSAAAQFTTRLMVGILYRVLTDRAVMAIAYALLAVSMVTVVLIPNLLGLVIAQVIQGASRSLFWSAAQLHVLRISASPARGMGRNQFVANGVGALGPIIAGYAVGDDPRQAAWLVAAIAVVGAALSATLVALPTTVRVARTSENSAWRHQGVRIAAFGSLAGGVFNVVILTFAPVVLDANGWDEAQTGLLVGIANGALLIGALAGGWVRPARFGLAVTIATLTVAAGVAAFGAAQQSPALASVGITLAGAATGLILTLSPTLGSSVLPANQQDRAVIVTGAFRAGALFLTPIVVAGVAVFMPLTAAMFVVGGATAIPGALSLRFERRG